MIEFEEFKKTLMDAYDLQELVEHLDITVEELVASFEDRIFDRYKDLHGDYEDESDELD